MHIFLQYILALLFLPAEAPAQERGEDLINWSATRKLTWADYKGRPDPNSDAAASTTTYLAIEYNITSNAFGYKIQSRFSRTRSWGLHKTEYILSHEQGHFDLAEVYARKLHKEMSEYRFDKNNFKKDLKKIYDEVTEEKEEMQNRYDRETRHSINKTRQAEWLQKIEDMLREYEAYADYQDR
jgi:hypothetical protein